MNNSLELLFSICILIIVTLLEWTSSTNKLILNDIKRKYWLICFIIMVIFSIIIIFNRSLIEKEEKQYRKLIMSGKKALVAFIIAYLAHLDFTLTPFWLIFIVSFFFHDWI